MKRLTFVICLACMTAATYSIQAQSVLKINILSPVVKTLNVSYEHAINETSSFQLGFFYTGWSVDATKFNGIGITPEYRFYLSESAAPQGVYVAPFLRYQNFKLEEKEFSDSKADFSTFGGGLVLGKQWVFKDKITLDIFIGPSYASGKVSRTGRTSL